jgi:hypothetical protein
MNTRKTPDARTGDARTLAVRAKARIDHFVDIHDDTVFADDELVDRNGVDLIGADEHGFWWGTADAAWCLHDWWASVRIVGRLGGEPWDGHFIGTDANAVAYAEAHGVTVEHIESGSTGLV